MPSTASARISSKSRIGYSIKMEWSDADQEEISPLVNPGVALVSPAAIHSQIALLVPSTAAKEIRWRPDRNLGACERLLYPIESAHRVSPRVHTCIFSRRAGGFEIVSVEGKAQSTRDQRPARNISFRAGMAPTADEGGYGIVPGMRRTKLWGNLPFI